MGGGTEIEVWFQYFVLIFLLFLVHQRQGFAEHACLYLAAELSCNCKHSCRSCTVQPLFLTAAGINEAQGFFSALMVFSPSFQLICPFQSQPFV